MEPRRRGDSRGLKWLLAAALAGLLAVDWFADGLGPRLLLGTALLDLTSDPMGATALVNGDAVGETPLHAVAVRPGSTVVRFEHRFHEAEAQRIELARDERRTVHGTFQPATGALRIVSNPRGAAVAIDGEPLATAAPVEFASYPTGAYTVSATLPGRQTKTLTVAVLPRELAIATFELERLPLGAIFLSLTPSDAQVVILDREEEYRPGVEFPPGKHRFRVRHHGFAPQTFEMAVRVGRNQRSVSLERLHGALRVAVEPPSASVTLSFEQGGQWRTFPYAGERRIPTGPVTIEARAIGYRDYMRRIELRPGPQAHAIRMAAFDVEPGRRFRDALASGGEGPLLVVVAAGTFRMGTPDGPADERPTRTVTVTQPFAIGVFELTGAEFGRFQSRGTDAALPETAVAWTEANDYLRWLSAETKQRYRLPSEAEWEYAARAGSTAPHPFDPTALCEHANIADETLAGRYRKYSTANCSDGALGLAPVGSYKANAFGVHDMLGNAKEWVQDCWHADYRDAPRTADPRGGDCETRVVRGGDWNSAPEEATVSFRQFSTGPNESRGFRVVREL